MLTKNKNRILKCRPGDWNRKKLKCLDSMNLRLNPSWFQSSSQNFDFGNPMRRNPDALNLDRTKSQMGNIPIQK